MYLIIWYVSLQCYQGIFWRWCDVFYFVRLTGCVLGVPNMNM